jgi:Leucine-rich repeat (LRR) protein
MSNASAVEALFFAALEKKTAAERAAYLDSACGGDALLRRQVEKLLKAHPKVGDFLAQPVAEQLAAAPEPPDATQAFDTSTDVQDAEPASPLLARTVGEAAGEESPLDFLQPSTRPGSLGRLGHYEILEVLGQGGFGIVFRAFDEQLQRVVAIKVLAPELAVTSPARKRFLREARSSARVRHENVVQVYAVEEEPLPYLVMEFIPGETLQQRIDRLGPLEVTEAVQIGRQIAEGLAAAHDQGLIHRDIKPGNILLERGPHEHVKLTDFGLARAADDASLTQSGIVAGTPMYMAPEQAQGDPLDHRADLFSLGSVLYTMCTGRPPFRANNTLAVLKRVIEDTPRPIPEIIPEVPRWLCELIARLQAKKPQERCASALEVADLLAHHLPHVQKARPVQTPPQVATPAVEKRTPALRRPRGTGRWAAAAAMLLLLLGGLGVTEATGVTDVRGTVIRLFSPEGTLEVQVDDPGISVQIDGSDLVITGAGAKEIRLKPGRYTVEGRKDGQVVSRELVTVSKNGKQVVRVCQEATVADPGGKKKPPIVVRPPGPTAHDAWIKALATLPLDQQPAALVARMNARLPGFEDAFLNHMAAMPADRQVFLLAVWLKERNPGFDGQFTHKIEDGLVTSLELPAPIVQDLTPLRALVNLRNLRCRSTVGFDNNAENDAAVLGALEALEKINDKPVAQFWKEVKARRAEFKEFLKVVAELTPEQQVAAVADRLKEHNPGFGGQVGNKIEGGVVTELAIGGNVTDLSPVRALAGLKVLNYSGPLSDLSPLQGMKLNSLTLRAPLRDLSPLQGMKLSALTVYSSGLRDLSPLKGMPLTSLDIGGWVGDSSGVQDLSPLEGMPLTTLNVRCNPVQNLSPLKGMPLTSLELGLTPVRDLTPLRGMKLTTLHLHNCTELRDLAPLKDMPLTTLNLGGWMGTPVRDLTPLKGMPLKNLSIEATGVTDLTPLQAMQLEQLSLTPKNITQGLNIVRGMKSLKSIGLVTPSVGGEQLLPASEFWARYDKQVASPDPDRRAAEYVLSLGGMVKVNEQGEEIKAAADLPRESFRLTSVNLWEKQMTAAGLAAFKGCKDLKELELHRSNVTDEGLAHFKDCKDLAFLNLTGTPVTDAGLAVFKDCKNLVHLNLSDAPITDAGLAHFKGNNNLTELWLYFTKVTGEGLIDFKGCKDLTFLNLYGTQTTDAGLAHIKNFKNLTKLSLAESRVTDAGLAHLKDCTSLKTLELKGRSVGSTNVSAAGIDALKKALPKCEIVWDGGTIKPDESRP